jgi:hypothetical protein
MGRPKTYENAAERQAAFRANNRRIDLVVPNELGDTLDEISEKLSLTKNSLVQAMIRFALTNHNWKSSGVWVVKK